MPKSKVQKTAPRAGTFATRRRDINRRIQEMILATLPPHQRELLRRTRGNPHLAFHLRRHIEALLAAEQALESLGLLDPSTTLEAVSFPEAIFFQNAFKKLRDRQDWPPRFVRMQMEWTLDSARIPLTTALEERLGL